MNRILHLSQDTGSYRRLQNAAETVERERGYQTYNNGINNLAVITKGQERVIDSRKTFQGKKSALNRAAQGQSVG